jgi:gamma-glutamylputrescine oxidase
MFILTNRCYKPIYEFELLKRRWALENNISRRNFLKRGAAVVGGAAAVTVGTEIITPMVIKEKLEFDQNNSFWALSQLQKNPPLKTDTEADIAIIGGGYTGLSAACSLKKRFPEKRIVLLEARSVGQGASGRNGGMILPQPSNEYMAVYSNKDSHVLGYYRTIENIKEISKLIDESGIDCDLSLKGILLVIVGRKQVDELISYSRYAQNIGMPIEFWDREKTKKAIGSDVYYGSLFDPNGGQVHPMKLVYALKTLAQASGVEIYEDSPVHEVIQGEPAALRVGADNIKVRAGAVVLATNGYTSKLGFFKNSVMAVHTQIAVTPKLPPSLVEEIGWASRMPFSDTRNILFHAGNTKDGRILIGAGHVDYFFNNGITYRGDINTPYSILKKELSRIYPKLAGTEFESIWSGIMGFTIDFNQSVGVMGKHSNIYYGLGYCGHGVNLSILFGRIISDLYAGEAEKWKDMIFYKRPMMPLPPEPLRWVGVQANIEYLKMIDKSYS